MIDKFYLPLLKSKAGEFTALSYLTPACKERIAPLFEVTRLEYDHEDGKVPKTIEAHLDGFCKKVVKNWPNSQMFLDTTLVDGEKAGDQTAIEYIYASLAKASITPLPVVYTSSTDQFLDTIGTLMLLYPIDEIGIRITIADITASAFEDKLQNILTTLDISAEKCHVILDLKDADFSSIDDFSDGITEVIKDFPTLREWKSFTVAGGAFPLMGSIKDSANLIPRGDWLFYTALIEKLVREAVGRLFNYGDYSIVSASYSEFNPKIMSTSANIRYTHDVVWYVAKGKALKKTGDWLQYYEQALQIVQSGYYLGANFSWGDAHIRRCADRQTTTGNANTWIAVGANHHFTKVISDLFSMSSVTLDT